MLSLILLNSVLVLSYKTVRRVAHKSSPCQPALLNCELRREDLHPGGSGPCPQHAALCLAWGGQSVTDSGLSQQWTCQVCPGPWWRRLICCSFYQFLKGRDWFFTVAAARAVIQPLSPGSFQLQLWCTPRLTLCCQRPQTHTCTFCSTARTRLSSLGLGANHTKEKCGEIGSLPMAVRNREVWVPVPQLLAKQLREHPSLHSSRVPLEASPYHSQQHT